MPKVKIESSIGSAAAGKARLPQKFAVRVYEDERGRPDVRVEFEVRDGVPSCRDVRVTARGEREVRATDLCAIRILDFLDVAVRNLILNVEEVAPGNYLLSPSATDDQRREGLREVTRVRRRRGDIDLARVAQVYRANVKDAPTQAVADAFGVAHRTAALYVKRAREAGSLGRAIQGKAGEQA